MGLPFYKQLNAMDCGPTCLRMVAKYYGKHYNANGIKQIAGYSKEGVSLLGISEAAENMGFRTRGVQLSFKQLSEDAVLPFILHWGQNHFVVLPPPAAKWKRNKNIRIADPAKGFISFTKEEFLRQWISSKNDNGDDIGIALLLEPTSKFYEQTDEKENKLSWGMVFQHSPPPKKIN